MQRPPLVFRLMLTSLFLPIFIGLGVLSGFAFVMLKKEHAWFFHDNPEVTTFGIPMYALMGFLIFLPFLLGLWLFWTGNWRRPVLTAGIFYFGLIFFSIWYGEIYTLPHQRLIEFSVGHGTDVYCNGIHLGKTPLHLNVEQLQAKVKPWDTPPEQRWYVEGMEPTYTWFPWDDFIEERYKKSRDLYAPKQSAQLDSQIVGSVRKTNARLAQMARHDGQSRFWWRFEKDGNQMLVKRSGSRYYLNTPFEKSNSYHISMQFFSPSAPFHGQLLADLLRELPPDRKADWDRHVLKHWPMIHRSLSYALGRARRQVEDLADDDPVKLKWTSALDSTTRLKYDLSDPPTEAECRRLLQHWIDESMEHKQPFQMVNQYNSGGMDASNVAQSIVSDGDREFVDVAIRLMGTTIRKPLAEQWKSDPYRLENGWASLAYIANSDKNTEYFADFVRYSATTGNARMELLGNEDERIVPLFKTLLYRHGNTDLMTRKEFRFANPITLYGYVDNPQTEPLYRQFVVDALSYPKLSENTRELLNRAVFNVVLFRSRMKEVDKEELADWVSTLPLKTSVRDLLVRFILIRRDGAKSFADRIQEAAGSNTLIDTDLTVEDMTRWFDEHPEGHFSTFLEDVEDRILIEEQFGNRNSQSMVSNSGEFSFQSTQPVFVPDCILKALLKTDTPESRKLIQLIWKQNEPLVVRAIAIQYGCRKIDLGNEYYLQTIDLPEYLLDLMEGSGGPWIADNLLTSGLALCELPKAGKLLEKWAESDNKTLRQQAQQALEVWRVRDKIRQGRMELFNDLVAEKIRPDDLLYPTPSWIWKDGRYAANVETNSP